MAQGTSEGDVAKIQRKRLALTTYSDFLPAINVRWPEESGMSLTELLVVIAIISTILAIGIPVLVDALQAIRGLMALVNDVVIH
jgi:prepilin-type N-terminal cleavage/methylation domain-containing protein